MASSGMFWFLTLAITLGGQALIHGITGGRLASEIFGSSYGSGIESWGMNLDKWLGPWGFIICGLVGTILYNTMNRKGKLYGYRWYHYLLSCVVSFACSAAWILVVLVISIAIIIIAIIVIIAIIIGIFSGR